MGLKSSMKNVSIAVERLERKKADNTSVKNNTAVLSKEDNVSVALCEFKTGDVANYSIDGESFSIRIKEDIPAYHKISLCRINENSSVYKYGQIIGKATCNIEAGQHVHSHNLVSIREYIE